MYAIETKYLPATNTKGARIVARYFDERIIVPYRGGISASANAISAAYAMCEHLTQTRGFNFFDTGVWCGVESRDGYVFVKTHECINKGRLSIRMGV